jgi:hypothetical protein
VDLRSALSDQALDEGLGAEEAFFVGVENGDELDLRGRAVAEEIDAHEIENLNCRTQGEALIQTG